MVEGDDELIWVQISERIEATVSIDPFCTAKSKVFS